MIPRNTTIPTQKSEVFSTYADNQPAVDINVLQGERQFAKDNKLLGTFRLDGIAPAMRGVPRIEVTFDIDSNGIVHVTAKDQGTGKEQNISITASTNMSKDDIDKAVKEAERYAEEDKKRRDEVDTKNSAENMLLQCEGTLKELGDKVSSDDQAAVRAKASELQNAVDANDTAAMKAKMDELQKVLMDVGAKIYQQPGGGAAGFDPNAAQGFTKQPGANDNNNDDVIDADFTET